MKTTSRYFSVGIIFCLIISCKKVKYPESTYRWGDPADPVNCPFFDKLTKYSVNGIDSLDFLDKYIDPTFYPPNSKISEIEFGFTLDNSKRYANVHFGSTLSQLSYDFSKDKRKITINFLPGYYVKKNLFVSKEITWEIIRLTKDDKPFILKAVLDNGNVYEIQIR